jgi:hypothetical protein
MGRRIALAGLAGLLAAPAFLIRPASAAILFTCDSVTGSAVFSPGLVHDTRPQSLSSGPTAPAGPADITLASTSDAGVKGNANSDSPSLSADGTTVAFWSYATNLDSADTDSTPDVYVKDLTTGNITLASTSDSGVKGNSSNFSPSFDLSLSADGSKVAFTSTSTNLDPADTDAYHDVYVKDLATGNITLASTSDTGVKSNNASEHPSLSADGSKVAFHSRATNLDPADTDSNDDVYVKDLATGDISLASTSDTGVKGSGRYPDLSADGTRVAFQSYGSLDPADTNQRSDAYVKDLTTGDLTLASTNDAGFNGDRESYPRSLSSDGTRVGLVSYATNFDSTNPSGSGAYYVKDLTTGDITLASTSDAGVLGTTGVRGLDGDLSSDGTVAALELQSTNLDPADTDTRSDIFVKDLTSGDLTLASTSDTGVKGNAASQYPSLSADGTRVAFRSHATNLDPADTDTQFDIYLKTLPVAPTSLDVSGCSNGNSGTASIVDIRSYGPRPLGCPVALGGAAGNDYADTTPILVGGTLSMTIDWATGPNSYGVAAAKAGPTGTQWRFRLAITASPGHDTPATNQYLPASGSGATKTRLQGKFDISALDGFNCTNGTDDPLSWLNLTNNGSWVAKTS